MHGKVAIHKIGIFVFHFKRQTTTTVSSPFFLPFGGKRGKRQKALLGTSTKGKTKGPQKTTVLAFKYSTY
jgi:hypothetical protein